MNTHHDEKPLEEMDEGGEEKSIDAQNGVAVTSDGDKVLTRRILLKLDLQIIPIMALLFLCSFLDRTNVGNAKVYNMEADIHITDHQYDTGLVVYYATYIASELPSNLVLKRVSPKIWLPFLTIIWGIITMCLGFVRNYAGLMTVRAFLGAAEGGLLPGIVLYLSGMYTRGEMAFRIGLFYTSASLSGSFGGLLARGLHEIGTRSGLTGWRWIFIIEGLLTVVVGFTAYFILPNNLHTAGCLSPEERIFAQQRLLNDRPTGLGHNSREHEHEPERFAWSEVRRGIFSIQLWLTATAYFAILAGLYSFGLFLPTIIVGMGYTPNEAQLWSVIPYAVAAVLTVFVAIVSDKLRLRGVIMLFTLPVAIIGYAVISNVSNNRIKYGMTFLMATGMYASVPCVLGWNSNNSAGHYKRATTTAMQLAIANSGGFVAAFIYPKKQGPEYKRGHSVVLGLLVFAWFMVLLNVLYCRKINRDKATGKHDKFIGYRDDRDPEFVMVL
ncbi:putative MFS transporter [Halenospora varia]|nr:putative MFS transporter [Halenospora varia]